MNGREPGIIAECDVDRSPLLLRRRSGATARFQAGDIGALSGGRSVSIGLRGFAFRSAAQEDLASNITPSAFRYPGQPHTFDQAVAPGKVDRIVAPSIGDFTITANGEARIKRKSRLRRSPLLRPAPQAGQAKLRGRNARWNNSGLRQGSCAARRSLRHRH